MNLIDFLQTKPRGTAFWVKASDLGLSDRAFAAWAEGPANNGALGAPAEVVGVSRDHDAPDQPVIALQLRRS